MINNVVNLKLNNGITVNIDKGSLFVSRYELEDHINDLLKFKKKYKPKEIIRLSDICDTVYNIMYCGANKEKKEIMFKLC